MGSFRSDFATRFKVTPRQSEVAELICKERSTLEIANALGISEKGVKYHATIIYKAARVKGRKELKDLVGSSQRHVNK